MIRLRQNTVTILILLVTSFLSSFGQSPSSDTPNCNELVFSDVRHIIEVDDYVGTEIVLAVCSGEAEINGLWNQYEGYNPAATNLQGRRSGNALRLTGNNNEGKVELVGRMTEDGLMGKLIWYIGKNRQEKDINLPRKECPVRPPK